MCAPRNMYFRNGFSSAIYVFIFLQEFCWGQQRSRTTSGGRGNDEFSCPEEFGYYPHPGDCTLYYVCVFGGALLESCTGGLMYSHELQTCDWPRNVGCGEANGIEGGASGPGGVNTNRVTETRGPPPQLQRGREPQQQSLPRDQQHPPQQVAKQLYEEEDLGPAEEEETDRQQRVYRGQPSTLSQVARDRDGLPRHTNALQSGPVTGKDKLSVVSYGSNQQYRVSVAPPNYVQQQQAPVHVASAGVANRGIYNGTQYNPSQQQFDSYYNLYNDESELYGDDDYGQYHVSSRGKPQIEIVQRLPEKNAVAYTPVQSYKQQENAYTPSYKTQGNVAYTPSYKQQSSDIYNVDDYNQQYNLQGADDDLSYQPGIIANKPSIRGRHRGSATYTTVSSDSDRGSLSGGRPTLKPSTSIVSKTSDYYDIYRFPPRRPEAVYPTPQVDKTAAKCRKDVCLLPDCYCGGKDIPGDLTPEETPQIVLLTFDDSVNDLNKGLYSDLFEKGRTNPNGCPISATFYVSHEWTDYSQVQNLYATGHEIASHSVSHSFGEQFSQKKWTREIAGQREILAAYGGVKLEDIRGMRAPFLAVGGNKMFKMLYDSNFTYDSSMPVYENRPPSWPYTFDYKIFHDCMIPPCPTRSYPGVWEVPMVMWQDLNGGRCSMGDACSNPPTADGVYKMLVKNFERHFTTNRAPLGLFYHAAWFTQPHHKEGFIAFLDTIVNMPEVWVVTNWQALQWVRDPTPISRLRNFTPFGCDYPDRPRKCNNPKVCNLWHKSGVRYMRTCQPCPDIYPWTGKTGIKNSKVDNEIIQE